MENSDKFNKFIKLILNDNFEYNDFISFLQNNNIKFCQFIMKVKNNDIIFKKIIKLIDVDYDFIVNSVKIIENTFNQNNHKKKYCHEYYLIMIYFMLNKFNQWSSLKLCILYVNTNKYHYKCINRQFILYTSKNIFKNLFIKTTTNDIVSNNSNLLIDASLINNKYGIENVSINPEYTKKNGTKISFITNTDKFFLSITPFDVNNKEINYDKLKKINIEKKNKKIEKNNKIKNIISENKLLKKEIKNIKSNKNIIDNKLTNKLILNDEVKLYTKNINNKVKINNKNVKNESKLDIKNVNGESNKDIKNVNTETNKDIKNVNDKSNKDIKNLINSINDNVNKVNKINIIKTSIHDVKTIQNSLNNIYVKFKNYNILTLTGDLGYLSNKKYYYNDNEVQLITPIRKNQKNKIRTLIESNNLKQRYKIENGFCLLKKYERIALRKDRKINTFMSFLYITCSIENNKIIKKITKK